MRVVLRGLHECLALQVTEGAIANYDRPFCCVRLAAGKL
jgi:hypothetical protein